MDVSKIPTPTYDYEVATLRKYYEEALSQVSAELIRLGLTDFERARVTATQAEIKKILSELNGAVSEWVAANIPVAGQDGVARSLVSLGLAASLDEARGIAKFSKLNREFIKTAVADTQADLLQITQNIDRRVRTSIQSAVAEIMRANLTQGINGTQSLKRDVLSKLDAATKNGIIDAAGRKWKPEVYAEMVVRTKMAHTQRETAINDGLSRDALYGIVSRHGAKDACSRWEGRVIKLSPDAPGDYPYIGDLPRREIFHPRCKHVVSPIRRPERAN